VSAPSTGGALELTSEPSGALVWLDGEPRGRTPLSVAVHPGVHRVALVASGRQLWHRSLDVDGGGRRLQVILPATPLLPGAVAGASGLKVRCYTRGELRVFVDGLDTGVECPNDHRLAVAPGRHTLSLYAPRTDELISVKREVDVKPGERSTRVYLKY
jgi:hypothetical protein